MSIDTLRRRTAAPAAVEEIHLALIPGLTNDSFYGTFACGAEAAAVHLSWITTSNQAADSWGLDVQQLILDAVLLQDPDGIAYVPHNFSAANPWIEERIAEGIPVVTFGVIVEPPIATQGRATETQLPVRAVLTMATMARPPDLPTSFHNCQILLAIIPLAIC